MDKINLGLGVVMILFVYSAVRSVSTNRLRGYLRNIYNNIYFTLDTSGKQLYIQTTIGNLFVRLTEDNFAHV